MSYNRAEIIDKVCERLIEGESLRSICAQEGMPNKATILRWLNEEEEFATIIARARELQAESLDDEIQQVINNVLDAKIEPNAAKVAIWAMQWRASKLKPKKYGEKLDVDHTTGGEKITYSWQPNGN